LIERRGEATIGVVEVNGIAVCIGIEVQASRVADRIGAEETADLRIIVTGAKVNESSWI